MTLTINKETIQKFDKAGPRYTSYPTSPIWSNEVNESVYIDRLKSFGSSNKTLSLYVHIPFCESMCTFCGCTTFIRQNKDRPSEEYLKYLFKEIDLVVQHMGQNKPVRQLHFGGGTPTFLNEQHLENLFLKIRKEFSFEEGAEIAIEVDPRTIDYSKIKKLKQLGFNRISMGVQDFEPSVQKAINRWQPHEMVVDFTHWCRDLGFPSINFDLIYGLPNQTLETFKSTIQKVNDLKPDRIALYSFAYVPWLKKHQNKIDKTTLPSADSKLDIFLLAREQLLEKGYQAIAMDHFALKNDELAKAFNQGELYRNFMGYTVKPADEYIGVGVSSIGHLENMFVHSYKTLPQYYKSLDQNHLPVEQGKILTKDDKIRQWVIRSFMCQFEVDKNSFHDTFNVAFEDYFANEQKHINECIDNTLLKSDAHLLKATELGKIFIRNICMGFDAYLKSQNNENRFSKTI